MILDEVAKSFPAIQGGLAMTATIQEFRALLPALAFALFLPFPAITFWQHSEDVPGIVELAGGAPGVIVRLVCVGCQAASRGRLAPGRR